MARTMAKQGSGSLAPWLGVAAIVILFDQLTKIAVARVFAYGEPHALTPFFNLLLVYNRGAAFSFLAAAGGWQRWAFTALGVVAAVVICYLLKKHGTQRLFCTALDSAFSICLGTSFVPVVAASSIQARRLRR